MLQIALKLRRPGRSADHENQQKRRKFSRAARSFKPYESDGRFLGYHTANGNGRAVFSEELRLVMSLQRKFRDVLLVGVQCLHGTGEVCDKFIASKVWIH